MFDYNHLISKSIGGNITAGDILPYENYLFEQTIKRVEHDYVEEIREGELTGLKLTAVLYLNNLKMLEIDSQLKSIIRLTCLYQANQQQLFLHAGFDTIEEWLDSFGLNGKSGTLSQLLAVAREIIPWTTTHNLIIGQAPVDLDWFKRIVNGKCIAARACLLVSLFRRTIKDGPLKLQKEIITNALAALEDPTRSRSYLVDTFNGYSSTRPIEAQKYILPDGRKAILLVANDNHQEHWIHKKLGTTTHFEKLYETIVQDSGYAWLSPQAKEHLNNI
jgi:hypothetical protein